MRKFLTALVAVATLAAAAVATSSTAEARWGGGWRGGGWGWVRAVSSPAPWSAARSRRLFRTATTAVPTAITAATPLPPTTVRLRVAARVEWLRLGPRLLLSRSMYKSVVPIGRRPPQGTRLSFVQSWRQAVLPHQTSAKIVALQWQRVCKIRGVYGDFPPIQFRIGTRPVE